MGKRILGYVPPLYLCISIILFVAVLLFPVLLLLMLSPFPVNKFSAGIPIIWGYFVFNWAVNQNAEEHKKEWA